MCDPDKETPPEKTCTKCKEIKPIDQFFRVNRKNGWGTEARCKTCATEARKPAQARYYTKNRDEVIERVKSSRKTN